MEQLTREASHELVAELQRRRCHGDDDLALITFVANRFRIAKNDARAIYDSFYHGFQHGADVYLGSQSRRSIVPENDPVFQAAVEFGGGRTADILEEKRAASGCLGKAILVVIVICLLGSTMI